MRRNLIIGAVVVAVCVTAAYVNHDASAQEKMGLSPISQKVFRTPHPSHSQG